MYTQCTGGDCEVECHKRLYTPFYSTEAQADYTLAHELGHIMLNTHNAAKAESKGLEIMKAANNTMTATAVQSDVALRFSSAALGYRCEQWLRW